MNFFLKIAGIFGLLILDQFSKYLARSYTTEPIEIFPFFYLRFVENTGIAFSVPLPILLVFLLAISVLIFLGFQLFYKKNSRPTCFSYIFIFSGALGNILDRIFWGKVTDFLSFWHFPIFNFADIFISFGIAILLWEEFFRKKTNNLYLIQ